MGLDHRGRDHSPQDGESVEHVSQVKPDCALRAPGGDEIRPLAGGPVRTLRSTTRETLVCRGIETETAGTQTPVERTVGAHTC